MYKRISKPSKQVQAKAHVCGNDCNGDNSHVCSNDCGNDCNGDNSHVCSNDCGNDCNGDAHVVTRNVTCLEQKTPPLNPKQTRQQEFLKAYTSNNFNITDACKAIKVNRKTYYHWLKNDPDFAENLKRTQDELKDYLKSKLLQLVEKNNLIATIFACKSLAGMVETTAQNIQVSEGPRFDQDQLDSMVRIGNINRSKYEKLLDP